MFRNLNTGVIGIRATMLEALELAKSNEFDGFDPSLGDAHKLAQDKSTQHVKGLFQDAGVQLGGWNLPVNWRGTDAEYYDHLAKLPERAAFAAELGCNRCITVIMAWDNNRPFRENWDFHVKRLTPPTEILNDYGISLAMEFIGPHTSRAPHKYGFLDSIDGLMALCAAMGTGNAGLLLDTWHCYTAHASLEDIKKLSKEDVVYVHINDAPAGIETDDQVDNVRALPGETGVIPLAEILRILKEIGYDGPVTPEPFSKKLENLSPEEATRLVSEMLDQVWREAGLT
jgi:sugar phosphate isomerase/epimerase|tara:strand:+ start:4785 stop:5642 length:858 start_codon:yes stop_codon:yes gene_type:complete